MIKKKTKREKCVKKCVIKLKLTSEDYRHCSEAIQFEKKINQPEKINLIWMVLEKIIKELWKQWTNNKVTAKI